MSQIQSAGTANASCVGPIQALSGQTAATGNTSIATESSQSAATSVSTTSTSSSSRITRSSSLLSSSPVSTGGSASDKLSALVMMLIQTLFGGNKDDEKDKTNPLVGLAALAMFSSLDPITGRFSYFQESSQVSQTVTTSSSSAVQATSYQQASGGATSGGSSLGSSLDVTG